MNDRNAPTQGALAPDIAVEHAVALHTRGNLPEAEKIYRAILKRQPNHFRTLSNLSGILEATGRHEEAVRLLRRALNQQPNSPLALTLLAEALRHLGRYEEAMERATRAVALESELADAHATLSRVLVDLGRYDEALRAQARAIELAPDRAHYYYIWGEVTRWTADDPRLASLKALARRSGSLSLDGQTYVHFALAKAYADCGDVERALSHQIEGGAVWHKRFRYHEAATLRQFDELCRVLDADWIDRHRRVGDPSPQPVFILGMPRSGTTLVEQIVASHPQVRALGESRIFSEALAQICKMPAVPLMLAQEVAQWSDSELRRLGALYLEASRRDALASAVRISDKMPGNFRHAGLIHATLPNARIIHTCRDPVDTCLSLFSILFLGDAQSYSYDLGELGRYYRAYEKMMAHWRSVLPAGVILDVKYEDVVDDLEGQARRIIAHCGLEWDDACLEFHKNARPVRTASHAQVRQPIYRSSVGKPRPPRELMRPLLEALGLD